MIDNLTIAFNLRSISNRFEGKISIIESLCQRIDISEYQKGVVIINSMKYKIIYILSNVSFHHLNTLFTNDII